MSDRDYVKSAPGPDVFGAPARSGNPAERLSCRRHVTDLPFDVRRAAGAERKRDDKPIVDVGDVGGLRAIGAVYQPSPSTSGSPSRGVMREGRTGGAYATRRRGAGDAAVSRAGHPDVVDVGGRLRLPCRLAARSTRLSSFTRRSRSGSRAREPSREADCGGECLRRLALPETADLT